MDKRKGNKFLKYSISIAILSTVSPIYAIGICEQSNATLVSGNNSPYAQDCPDSKNGVEFTGDASAYLKQFKTEIKSAGEEIANQIASNASAEIDTMTKGSQKLIETLYTLTNTEIKDSLTQDKMLLDMKMNYQTELQEKEIQAEKSVISLDDSKEEVLFILDELKNTGNGSSGNYNHAQEVIAAMKAKYDDDPNFLMPIRIKSADAKTMKGEGCPAYDPKLQKEGKLDSSCFYGVKASPGHKLEKYFEECSRAKRKALESIKQNVSSAAAKTAQASSQSKYLNKSGSSSSSELAKNKLEMQRDTSCTQEQFDYKVCQKNLSESDYIKKVIDNEIVPFANVSSTNYLSPVSIGTIDGKPVEATDEEIKAMRAKSVDVNPDVAVSENTPPIVDTYRTSSQYLGAIDFVNNVVNKEAVSNEGNITKMKDLDSSLAQSVFMNRAAALSLAENSLMQPIKARTGTKISTAIADGSLTPEKRDVVIKEDVDGAGELDRLFFSINKDYERLTTDAKSAADGGGIAAISTAPTGSLEEWQIEALVQGNMLAYKNYEQNEKIELLLANLVALNANSQENINYINSLK